MIPNSPSTRPPRDPALVSPDPSRILGCRPRLSYLVSTHLLGPSPLLSLPPTASFLSRRYPFRPSPYLHPLRLTSTITVSPAQTALSFPLPNSLNPRPIAPRPPPSTPRAPSAIRDSSRNCHTQVDARLAKARRNSTT
eukprot:1662058-Rhodomonas_salina.2